MRTLTKLVAPVVINHDEGEILVNGSPVHFTPSQYKILRAIVNAGGKIVTRSKLMAEVYGRNAIEHDVRTVDQSVCRTRQLLRSASKHLVTVSNRGYRWSVR